MSRYSDARFGRIKLPTIFEDVRESVGFDVEATGMGVFGLGRRPRSLQLTLPAYGRAQEPNPYESGGRIRRQARSLLDNPAAVLQGVFFDFAADPELNSWLVAAGGEISYEDGGPAIMNSYKIALSDAYQVGSRRTHRPGRRILLADRRLASTPRDVLQRVYSTDYSSKTALALNILPVRVSDTWLAASGLAPAVFMRRTLGGDVAVYPSGTHGQILDFEQDARKTNSGDVAIFDRRGNPDALTFHHPYGYASTIPANPARNPYPRQVVGGEMLSNGGFENDLTGWTQVPATSTLSAATDFPYEGAKALKIESATAANAYVQQDFAMVAGRSYLVRGFVRGDNVVASGSQGAVIQGDVMSGTAIHTDPTALTGTFGYTERSFVVHCTAAGTFRVYAQLGFGGNATGTAWFDAISVKDVTAFGWGRGSSGFWALGGRGWFEESGGPTHGSSAVSQGYVRFRSDATASQGFGVVMGYVQPVVFRRGRTYRFSIRVNLLSGSSALKLLVSDSGGVSAAAAVNFTAANTWNDIFSLDWTPTADVDSRSAGVTFGVQTQAAAVSEWGMAHVACMDITDIPTARRPTHALYCDGEQPGCAWMGTANESPTRYEAGRVNLHYNPLPDPASGTFTSTGVALSYEEGLRARRSTQPKTLRLRRTSGTDSYASIDSRTPVSAPSLAVPDQTFRFQGQYLVYSAWVFIDAPPGTPVTLVSGGQDRSLLWDAGAAVFASAPITSIPAGVWTRVRLAFQYRGDGYSSLALRAYNTLDAGMPVHYTDFQLEFGWEATDAFNGNDHETMWHSANRVHSGYSVEHNPEAFGWENVLGPNYPLTPGDVPVLENGLVRVRWVGATSAFAIESAGAAGGYQELGRVTVYRDSPSGTYTQYVAPATSSSAPTRLQARVIEWTPERAVIRVTLGITGSSTPNRCEVYVTLQRGWTGPRVEAYASWDSAAEPGVEIRFNALFSPNLLGNLVAAYVGGATTVNSAGENWSIVSTTIPDPWVYLTAEDRSRPSVVLIPTLAGQTANNRTDSTAYADAPSSLNSSRGYGFRSALGSAAPLEGYASMQIGVVDAPGLFEAEHYVNSASTTARSVTGEGVGNAVVVDTQTAATANTLVVPAAAIGPALGRFGVWARVRVTTSGDTLTAQAAFTGESYTAAVTSTSTSFVWLYLGESLRDAATDNLEVRAYRSAGTGTTGVRIDRVFLVPLERRTGATADYTGAREQGEAALYDSRQEPLLVAR